MITVAYICPSFLPRYAGPIARFADSYKRYPSATPHRFVLVLKGESEVPACFDGLGVTIDRHDNECMDCGSYQKICHKFPDSEAVCCLGTNSVVMVTNWLEKLSDALFHEHAVLAGVSGSYESWVTRYYNPHIRTTGFIIRPRDFDRFYPEPILSRDDCLEFECGRHKKSSITRRILIQGGKCLVVGRNGRCYDVPDWGKSGGFRRGDEGNLLIWDNRAEEWFRASTKLKNALHYNTWTSRPEDGITN